ncbi:MAG: DUF924 domain-containing protein [Acetobacteraceae bacterium]|nr:DUF924 domain-containing protein [Acetobacteraceae bacterium]
MTTADDVLAFWFAGDRHAWREAWFKRDDGFDAAIRDHFGALPAQARDGALDTWAAAPAGALALTLVLDQFPRNLHRGSAEAFACDGKARAIARAAVLRDRFDLALTPNERAFLYLPFEHSESMADQDLSVALFEGLRDHGTTHTDPAKGTIAYAWAHSRVIQAFGRFPHRNAAIGRATTPAEQAWLDAGGGF